MWICFLFVPLVVINVQAGAVLRSNKKQADQPMKVTVTGTGTVNQNGQATLNLNLQGIPGTPLVGVPGVTPTTGASVGTTTAAPTTMGPTTGPPTTMGSTTGSPTTMGPTTGTATTGTPTSLPTVGGTPVTVQAGAFSEEEQLALKKHNEYRRTHQVPLMTLDRAMSDQAKAYAGKLAATGTLKHASSAERNGNGENLYYACTSGTNLPSTGDAVKAWYDEVCSPGYNFDQGSFSGGTGHFTQVVWKGSKQLGIGTAEGTKHGLKCVYVVGRYNPPGNWQGEFQENVPRGNFDESYCQSVASKRQKYFDHTGKPVYVSTPFSEVARKKKKKGYVSSSRH